mmetsp:Transcript_28570/g.92272  ORF Transcript_28570/g.92272 Transcript_28570/m.92272 type:complete len:259 (-) Transcript_28570:1768-2544(-)|eukprot:scaffold31493_cov101-Isochrysis_galbana.AAC.2
MGGGGDVDRVHLRLSPPTLCPRVLDPSTVRGQGQVEPPELRNSLLLLLSSMDRRLCRGGVGTERALLLCFDAYLHSVPLTRESRMLRLPLQPRGLPCRLSLRQCRLVHRQHLLPAARECVRQRAHGRNLLLQLRNLGRDLGRARVDCGALGSGGFEGRFRLGQLRNSPLQAGRDRPARTVEVTQPAHLLGGAERDRVAAHAQALQTATASLGRTRRHGAQRAQARGRGRAAAAIATGRPGPACRRLLPVCLHGQPELA